MTSRDEQVCGRILSEIAMAKELLGGISAEDFEKDERTARAVCMTLINIGELVKNLTPELKSAHPEIPWRAISGMRDVTAHRYQTLRMTDVYNTCVDDLPLFYEQMKKLAER